jgi:hypothetical protein
MGSKPKARIPTKGKAKAKKATKEKSQRERFIEAARSVGVDETGKEFEAAIRKHSKTSRS